MITDYVEEVLFHLANSSPVHKPMFKLVRPRPNRIRELRERAGLSQSGLGKLSGTSYQQIYKLEKGINVLTTEWMVRLGVALGVRPAALIDPDVERLAYPEGTCEVVNDPDELALLSLWRNIGDDLRMAALTLLRAGLSSEKKTGTL